MAYSYFAANVAEFLAVLFVGRKTQTREQKTHIVASTLKTQTNPHTTELDHSGIRTGCGAGETTGLI